MDFCLLDLRGYSLDVQMKQIITKKTNIYPVKNTLLYMREYTDLLEIKSVLPRDIMRKIVFAMTLAMIFGIAVLAEAALIDRGGGLIYCDTLDMTSPGFRMPTIPA